jgi:hypothetical protein
MIVICKLSSRSCYQTIGPLWPGNKRGGAFCGMFLQKIDLTMVDPQIPGFVIARCRSGKYDVSMNCHAQVVIKESKRCS